jgi:ubiquinone/menaquinone biosynthesis C-methylase UbiE
LWLKENEIMNELFYEKLITLQTICGYMQKDSASKSFLRNMVVQEFYTHYGVPHSDYVDGVINSWFNDDFDRDGRWTFLQKRLGREKLISGVRILDVASGCATFVLHGLKEGYNVWGVEPEKWKIDFLTMKVNEMKYPKYFKGRVIRAIGENLPFPDGVFDVVTTHQTLEHVHDVKQCLFEMLRVMSQKGILYILAPSYNSFYEPHYRLPFLPRMNRRLAKLYLLLLGRPTRGIDGITYVTKRKIVAMLSSGRTPVEIEDTVEKRYREREERIRQRLGIPKELKAAAGLLNFSYEIWKQMRILGRRENEIALWISKSQF